MAIDPPAYKKAQHGQVSIILSERYRRLPDCNYKMTFKTNCLNTIVVASHQLRNFCQATTAKAAKALRSLRPRTNSSDPAVAAPTAPQAVPTTVTQTQTQPGLPNTLARLVEATERDEPCLPFYDLLQRDPEAKSRMMAEAEAACQSATQKAQAMGLQLKDEDIFDIYLGATLEFRWLYARGHSTKSGQLLLIE